tara:strand:+ start:2143 stop:2358 length:216 start_codon:yes stop_codon:yes gene_type:complete
MERHLDATSNGSAKIDLMEMDVALTDLGRFRCYNCGATLAKVKLIGLSQVEIRCPRCRKMNRADARQLTTG